MASFLQLHSPTTQRYWQFCFTVSLSWALEMCQHIGIVFEKNIQKVLKELNPPLYFIVLLAYILVDSRPRFQHAPKCNYLFCFILMFPAITMHIYFQNIFYIYNIYMVCINFVPILISTTLKHQYHLSKKVNTFSFEPLTPSITDLQWSPW